MGLGLKEAKVKGHLIASLRLEDHVAKRWE